MRDTALPRLKAALIGPSDRRSELMKEKFAAGYGTTSVPGLSRQQYVAALHANYVATYQKRAAIALADNGGREAKAAIADALRDSSARHYRSDVMQVIRLVTAQFNYAPFRGSVTPRHVSFGRIIKIGSPPGHPFGGQSNAYITDSPFSVAEVPVSRSADTLRFPALADLGTHIVAISNGTTDTSRAEVTITSLVDSNDSAMTGCSPNNITCIRDYAPQIQNRLPFSAFLTLWGTPPRADYSDYFRIEAGASQLPVTATLDWKGTSNLDLRWGTCGPFTIVGSSSGATAANPEHTSTVVPAQECRLLIIRMHPGLATTAFAHLTVTTP